MYQNKILILFLTWALNCHLAHAQSLDAKSLDLFLDRLIDNKRMVGGSLLIYKNNREIYYGDAGYANVKAQQSWSRDTLAHIYSMTKPITGAVLLSLYEDGLFRLNDPVSMYLPEFKNQRVLETAFSGVESSRSQKPVKSKREITILDLMRHTSGLTYDWQGNAVSILMQDLNVFDFDKTLKVVSEEIARLPLVFHPGERWHYGASSDIQARLAEVISGKPYQDLLQEVIFDPLNMHATSYSVSEHDKPRLSLIYDRQDSGEFIEENIALLPGFQTAPVVLTPGGHGLIGSIDDYMRFSQMLLNYGEWEGQRVLSSDTVKQMYKDQLPINLTEKEWLDDQLGFGLNVSVRVASPKNKDELFGVPGEISWNGHASTLFWVDPKNKLSVVFFTQKVPFDRGLHKDVRKHVYRALSLLK